MNKNLAVILALVLVIALTAACGNNDNASDNAGASSSAAPSSAAASPSASEPAEPAAATTLEAKHKYGVTTIPANPQNAFVTLQRFADPLLALGIKPGTIIALGNVDHLKDYIDGVNILSDFPAKPEAVLAAKPDFVLGDPWVEQTTYDQLSKIAPTIVLGEGDKPMTWRDVFLYLAETFGKKAEYDAFMAKYNEKAAAAKEELAAKLKDETVMILRVEQNRIMLWGNGDGFTEEVLYKDLGLKSPANLPQSWTDISLEALTDYDADHIFLEVRSTAEGSKKFFDDQVAGSAVWKSMKAVQNNHVYPIASDLWVEGNGPIAYMAVIDQVREYLLGGA
ncbi:ABC transporter substrate-binding protein [Cohnella sp. GCM10027633]|uniref:ABC transporter substrate-binding protein n=1 Tax=unclassified Cohnella TaxID=2636738 RepID=UPI00363EC105